MKTKQTQIYTWSRAFLAAGVILMAGCADYPTPYPRRAAPHPRAVARRPPQRMECRSSQDPVFGNLLNAIGNIHRMPGIPGGIPGFGRGRAADFNNIIRVILVLERLQATLPQRSYAEDQYARNKYAARRNPKSDNPREKARFAAVKTNVPGHKPGLIMVDRDTGKAENKVVIPETTPESGTVANIANHDCVVL